MADFTTLWAFVRQRRHLVGNVIIGLVLFVAGVQVGKTISPYYAAHPIVFEDRQCSDCQSSGGSRGELQALQEAGTKQAGNDESTTIKSEPAAVAGTTAPTSNEQPTQTSSTKRFVGSVNSNLYHDPSCSASKRIKEENQLWFDSEDEAAAAGYSPSKCTRELLGV